MVLVTPAARSQLLVLSVDSSADSFVTFYETVVSTIFQDPAPSFQANSLGATRLEVSDGSRLSAAAPWKLADGSWALSETRRAVASSYQYGVQMREDV
jgi:hypothetical protein